MGCGGGGTEELRQCPIICRQYDEEKQYGTIPLTGRQPKFFKKDQTEEVFEIRRLDAVGVRPDWSDKGILKP